MAEGQKVGEVFVEIGADGKRLHEVLEQGEARVRTFAGTTERQGKRVSATFVGIGSTATKAAQSVRRLTNAILLLPTAFIGAISAGRRLGATLFGLEPGARSAISSLDDVRKAIGDVVSDSEKRRINAQFDALAENLAKTATAASEQIREEFGRIGVAFNDDFGQQAELRRAVDGIAQYIEKERTKALKRAEEEAAKSAAEARAKEQGKVVETLRGFEAELVDERAALTREYYRVLSELQGKATAEQIDAAKRIFRERLKLIDDEERKKAYEERRRMADEHAERVERQEAIIEEARLKIEAATRVAAEQRRLDAQRFQGLDVSASSGGDAVRLLRSIERSSRAAAQRRFPLGASANGGGV